MPEYTKHNVWHVTVTGEVDVEAATKEQAIERSMALFVAGEGILSFNATLHETKIEIPAPP